jgi:hypothetical protein
MIFSRKVAASKSNLFTLLFAVAFTFVANFLLLERAQAFPEMVRSGYTNCTSCHVSPTGGGLLTDYGRNLSSEVLSTWGNAQEAQIAHGIFGPKPEEKEEVNHWLGIGADVRAVQTRYENDFVKVGRFIWMQAMLDVGYRLGSWTGVMSIGKFDNKGEGTWSPYSERFYLMKQLDDANLIRVGRFIPAFGLNLPDHISSTRGGPRRNGLGFGISQERDAAEWHYIGENWNTALGFSEGPRDNITPFEQSIYGQVQRAFLEHYKVGMSLWSGHGKDSQRQIAAVHGLFGFTPHFYLVSELDAQILHNNGDSGPNQLGLFGDHKLGWEFYKGMHVFALLDHLKADSRFENQFSRRIGGGLQFFPRPHFEILGAWTKELVKSDSNKEGDYAWLLLHYYI